MDNLSHFESRQGTMICSDEDLFNFVTDFRNFDQFVSAGPVNSWISDKEACSFRVSILGNVNMRLAEKEKHTRVLLSGNALDRHNFLLTVHITGIDSKSTEVRLSFDAELNPVLKMMASGTIAEFLEKLISEMENFRSWKNIRE
jgi:carbon monoxide dehydrogenase subunit G